MAKYTMELRQLVKSGYNIFDDTWNTFIPEHKAELCDKIIRHYWFNEIGQETPDRFKHYLNEQLALIMPYYNQLYKSELEEIIPLFNLFIDENENTDRVRANNLTKVNKSDTINIRQMAQSLQRLSDSEANQNRDLDTTGTKNWEEHKVGNEKETENQTRDTDTTTDQDTTEKTVFSSTKDTVGKEVFNETMSDTQDGTKDTTGHSDTTTGSTRLYSDTPQANITAQGMSINEQYLTNYTRESGTQTVDSTGKETVHNQENKTTDHTKDNTETETTSSTTDVTGTLDKTENTDETIDKTRNKDWTEDTNGNEDTKGTEDETIKDTETETVKQYENGSTQDNGSTTSAGDEKSDEKEGVKHSKAQKGFTVSQAELLIAWRKTFLNIDAEIIKLLGGNFIGVF